MTSLTMITIYNKYNEPKFAVGVNEGSIRKYTLMQEDYIRLKFTTTENVPLLIGDYVDITSYIQGYDNEHFTDVNDDTTKLFVIDRNYYPKYNNANSGWDYDVQINAYYYKWKNYVLMYDHSSGMSEAAFDLTDNIEAHVGLILKNLEDLGIMHNGRNFHHEIADEQKKMGMKHISYSSVSIYDCLDLIASTFECEWWIIGDAIHFGIRKDNADSPLRLDLNDDISNAQISDSEGVHATRLYAFGGTTNVPKHYRERLDFTSDEIGSDYVIDTKKPIKTEWFFDEKEAPVQKNELKGAYTSNNEAVYDMYETQPYKIELNVGKVNLSARKYSGIIKDLTTDIQLAKLETHNKTFGFDVHYEVVLKGEGKEYCIYEKTVQIDGNIDDITDKSHSRVWKAKKNGFITEEGKFDSNSFGNDVITIYGQSSNGTGYVGDLGGGLKNSKTARFGYSSETYNDIDKDCQFTFLTPYESHNTSRGYYFYVRSSAYNTFYVQADKATGLWATKDFKPKLSDKLTTTFSKKIEHEGEYDVIIRASVVKTTNIIAYYDVTSPALAFSMSTSSFALEIQQEAKYVETKLQHEGVDYDVIVNPDLCDNDDVNSSKVKFNGRVPFGIGGVYQLPNIIRTAVKDAYFTQRTNGVTNAIVQKNIMLPEGELPYIQAKDVEDDDVVEAIRVYDWIYPKTNIEVLRVSDASYTIDGAEGEDPMILPTYLIEIGIKSFNWDKMVVDDNLYVIFQDGKAVGLRFELEYIGNGKIGDTETAIFKIIPNEDYSVWLPNEDTKPQSAADKNNGEDGDIVILEGIDITYFDANAVVEAEEEVKAQAEKDILITSKEDKVVDITLASSYAYNNGRIALGSIVSLGDILGSQEQPYESRIIGYEEKLDIPYDSPKYIVGENYYYSRIRSVESRLEEVKKASTTFTGFREGGSSVKIIKAKDSTAPTDSNVYSALRSRDEFVKRNEDDTLNGNISIKKSLSVDGDATFGGDADVNGNHTVGGNQSIQGTQSVQGQATFHDGARGDGYTEQGDIIQGWNIDKEGIASFAKVKTPSMQVYELTLNRKTAVQGEFVFSDGEVVESVEFKGADTYRLTVRALYEGYITTFKKDDILYSNINIIGSSAKTGKCWMYVTAVDGNKITAVHFPYEACPAGENIPPIPYMTITRHGNITDKARQDLFIISSETSSLTMLRGVSAPIVRSEGLYGVVIGKLPATLLSYIHEKGHKYVNSEDPYVYARGVIVQDLIMLDYHGKPIVQERYRGEWRQDIANGLVQGEDTYQATTSVADTVTYNGSLWRCMVSGTTVPPKDNIAEWQKKVSKGDDSTAVIYTLKPSSNIVYYRTASKTLSVDELTVKVSVAGNGEYYDIADQDTLEQAGLSVYYALDGEGEPILLNISPDGEILLEDGSGFIESEDGSDLLLEGEVLDITRIKDNITLYLKDLETGEMRASYVIPVIKDGEEGKQGRMLYPAGEWNEKTSYAIENNSAPFVKEGSTYYVLVWEGSAVKGEKPSADKQGVYWRPFTYMNYLFAEFLMANWAMFGTEGKGGIFYDKYLFSQKVIKDDGEEDNYNKGIFDANGKLSGAVPKLMLDFVNGSILTTNLIEQYRKYDGSVIEVSPSGGFNIYIPSNPIDNNDAGWSFRMKSPLVILPSIDNINLEDYEIEGSHITITYGIGGGKYAKLMEEVGGHVAAKNEFLLVCVDKACITTDTAEGFDKTTYITDIKGNVAEYGIDNFIFHGGRRGKYVLMSPGSTLKLKPYVVDEGEGNRIYWMVDGGDVYEKNLTVYHTAYSLPTQSVYPRRNIKVILHNDQSLNPYEYINESYESIYQVYAQKTLLKGASATDEQNLLSDYHYENGYQYGICFACGLLKMLPDEIIITAQCDADGNRLDAYDYHCRAFDPVNDDASKIQ